jgi:DHA2 family multidrug resistance protein
MDAASAAQQATATVYGMIVRQAMVLSYIDNFRILAFLCFLCVPAAFIFKRVREAKPIEGAH